MVEILLVTRVYQCLRTFSLFFFFQAEDGIRDVAVTGVQTCALPIFCRLLSLAPEEEAVQLWGAHFFGDGNAAWSFHLAQVLRTRQDCRYNVSDRCLHLNHDDSQI